MGNNKEETQVLHLFSKYPLPDKPYISDVDYKNITREKLFAFLEKSLWGLNSQFLKKKNNNNQHLSDFWESNSGECGDFYG